MTEKTTQSPGNRLGMVRLVACILLLPIVTAVDVDVDVVVIGAGFAGAAAAHRLVQRGLSIHLIEATASAGGRTRNFDLASHAFDTSTDSVVEVGGTFVAPGHTELIALAKETGHPIYNVSGQRSIRWGGRATLKQQRRYAATAPAGVWPWWYWGVDTRGKLRSSVMYTAHAGRSLFQTPADIRTLFSNATWATLEAAGDELAALTDTIDCQEDAPSSVDSSSASAWFDRDLSSFEGWIAAQASPGLPEEARSMLRNMCRGMIAQEPSQVSLLSILKSLKGCWSSGAEDQYRVRGGTQAIPLTLTARLAAPSSPNSTVTFHSPVRLIDVNAAAGVVTITHGVSSKQVTARWAIVTGSPAAVAQLSWSPPLEPVPMQLLQRMPMGTSMKYFVQYDSPWWRSANLSGAVMVAGFANRSVPREWGNHFDQCMEHSPFDGTVGEGEGEGEGEGHHYALMCWVEGETNLHFISLNKTTQRERVLTFLEKAYADPRARTLAKGVVAFNWASEP
tara:strand:- start:2236 stop:3756 length:1521 start_codon:yes stop_codon:yes gene_type:complete